MEMNVETSPIVIEDLKLRYPKIKDRTSIAVVEIFLCAFLPGLIALFYNGKALELYCQAIDENERDLKERDALYKKAVRKNKIALAWIIGGFSILPLGMLISFLSGL